MRAHVRNPFMLGFPLLAGRVPGALGDVLLMCLACAASPCLHLQGFSRSPTTASRMAVRPNLHPSPPCAQQVLAGFVGCAPCRGRPPPRAWAASPSSFLLLCLTLRAVWQLLSPACGLDLRMSFGPSGMELAFACVLRVTFGRIPRGSLEARATRVLSSFLCR